MVTSLHQKILCSFPSTLFREIDGQWHYEGVSIACGLGFAGVTPDEVTRLCDNAKITPAGTHMRLNKSGNLEELGKVAWIPSSDIILLALCRAEHSYNTCKLNRVLEFLDWCMYSGYLDCETRDQSYSYSVKHREDVCK